MNTEQKIYSVISSIEDNTKITVKLTDAEIEIFKKELPEYFIALDNIAVQNSNIEHVSFVFNKLNMPVNSGILSDAFENAEIFFFLYNKADITSNEKFDLLLYAVKNNVDRSIISFLMNQQAFEDKHIEQLDYLISSKVLYNNDFNDYQVNISQDTKNTVLNCLLPLEINSYFNNDGSLIEIN